MQTDKKRKRDRKRYRKARNIFRSIIRFKEPEIQNRIAIQNPQLVSLDRAYRPDFWNPELECFIELKMASRILIRSFFDLHSKHFPGYYFKRMSLKGRSYLSIDDLLALYPKPLIVRVYDLQTGEFLGEKFFPNNQKQKIKIENRRNDKNVAT